MIQDYFSIDRRGKNYYLFRIINKVDFEEEVVYARDTVIENDSEREVFVGCLLRYLIEGFDSLDGWTGDKEGFHSPIQHFGFECVVRSGNLIPLFLLWKGKGMNDSTLLHSLFLGLEQNSDVLQEKVIETETGNLHKALLKLGAKTFKPKDPNANVPIPLGLALAGKLDEIGAFLENYS